MTDLVQRKYGESRTLLRTLFGIIRSIWLPEKYGIKRGYFHRSEVEYFDDTLNRDEYQKEVYEKVAELMDAEGLKTICDLGCGSGYKLIHYLGRFETRGVELTQTLDFLQTTYPDREWFDSNDDTWKDRDFEVLLCADVIEHIEDPATFLEQIQPLGQVSFFIFSTPDRDLKRGKWSYGPPVNPYHYREWNMKEFRSFLESHFEVKEQFISNREQATQVVICKSKS